MPKASLKYIFSYSNSNYFVNVTKKSIEAYTASKLIAPVEGSYFAFFNFVRESPHALTLEDKFVSIKLEISN